MRRSTLLTAATILLSVCAALGQNAEPRVIPLTQRKGMLGDVPFREIVGKHPKLLAAITLDGTTVAEQLLYDKRTALLKALLLQNNAILVKSRNARGETLLHAAVHEGNAKLVRQLLKYGADVNARDKFGDTALHRASAASTEELILSLLANGAKVNQQNEDGFPAFWSVFGQVSSAVDQALLAKGATIDLTTSRGTLLHVGVTEDNKKIVTACIQAKADVNSVDSSGRTALCFASSVPTAALLLRAGIKLEKADQKGRTAFHHLIDHPLLLKLLVDRGASFNTQDKLGLSPMHLLMIREDPSASLTVLLEAGPQVNIKDKHGYTPLHIAATHVMVSNAIKTLLDKGADVSIAADGFTPYDLAYAFGNRKVLPLLKSREGPSPQAKLYRAVAGGKLMDVKKVLTENPRTKECRLRCYGMACSAKASPLSYAAWLGHAHLVAILNTPLAHQEKNTFLDGFLPIHHAAQEGHVETLKALLQRSVSADTVNVAGSVVDSHIPTGTRPLSLAAQGNHLAAVTELLQANADPSLVDSLQHSALYYALRNENVGMAVSLLRAKSGWDGAEQNPASTNLLMQAVQRMAATEDNESRNGALADALFLAGSKVGLAGRTPYGNTPLHLAAYFGPTKLVSAILKSGGAINAVNSYGETPLHVAARCGHYQMIEAMLAYGAKRGARNAEGMLPVDVCSENQHRSFAKSSKARTLKILRN